MTRQVSYVMILTGIMALLVLSPKILAQHQWTSLDGPFWASGIDVAYGNGGNGLAWHRYLAGSNGGEAEVFYWADGDSKWFRPTSPENPLSANKLISYKVGDNGQIAVGSVFEDDVWITYDGGVNWDRLFFPQNFNTHFSSIDIITQDQNPGNTILVASSLQSGQASAYHTTDAGTSWAKLGAANDPLDNLEVYDIEAAELAGYTVGTSDGLYFHESGQFNDPWDFKAFDQCQVMVLENVDLWHAEQVAAVIHSGPERKLYYTSPEGTEEPWDDFDEILIENESFDKEVTDIAAVYLYTNEVISCYIATTDGVYIVQFTNAHPEDAEMIDVKTYYTPMQTDKNIKAVDYHFYSDNDYKYASVLAATPYNVYEINTTYDRNNGSILDIAISEQVIGTFWCNIIAPSFPENSFPFTISENGLIKSPILQKWALRGFAFESEQTGLLGTDISTDFNDPYTGDIILASSKNEYYGTIMRSTDGGDTWVNRSPDGDPKINSVDLDPVSEDAFAAGEEENSVWFSSNNGFDWGPSGSFPSIIFNDIYSDPDPNRDDFVYAGGYYSLTSVAAYIYDGSNWSSMTNGLPGTSRINQFAKGGTINSLYAATDTGVFKAGLDTYPITWSARTYGIGTSNLGSVVVDKNNPYGLLTSTAPGVIPPHIWASGDSGRSWIDLPLGDIPNDAHINRLAASQDENSGFLVGTDVGVFALGNIFRAGTITSNEIWGPGVVIVNGDISITGGVEVTIQAPCTIYSVYDFDIVTDNPGDLDPNRTEIAIFSGGSLSAIGDQSNRILFTSSRPANKSAGDWTGIVAGNGHDIELQFCDIEYAAKGVNGRWDGYPVDFDVFNCSFKKMQTAGVELFSASTQNEVTIRESIFEDCGTYGIRIYHDHLPAALSMEISGNNIIDCDYGIWYSGGSNFGGSKKLNIADNILTQASAYTGNYGIYAIKYQGAAYDPVVNIIGDSISYFYDGGIYLNSISTWSTILDNRVKRNKNYGIYLANSSPKIGSSAEDYNSFSLGSTGIYCDLNSHPKVRWTQIKENTKYGVLIDSNYPCDFGTELEWGNNSIDLEFHPSTGYRDMKNTRILVQVSAERNWWGEPRPDPTEIEGDIDYLPARDSDPLPFSPKRAVNIADLPLKFSLEQNFPNPFNPMTTISLYIKEPGQTSLKVYNLRGQLVQTLIDGQMDFGDHSFVWDGKNENGKDVSSGIYFYVLATEYGKTARRMTLLR